MTPQSRPFDPGMPDFVDEVAPIADGYVATAASVRCPWCGERVAIGLDPGGGLHQEYVEDCEVCCRPWRVDVAYSERGGASVQVEREGG